MVEKRKVMIETNNKPGERTIPIKSQPDKNQPNVEINRLVKIVITTLIHTITSMSKIVLINECFVMIILL